MRERKAITPRLEAEDYQRLEAEARRLGMRPGALARLYVRAGLSANGEPEAKRRRRVGLEALEHLEALRAELRREGYPSIDAVQVCARAARSSSGGLSCSGRRPRRQPARGHRRR